MIYRPSTFIIEKWRSLFKRRLGDADLAYLGDTHGDGARVDVPGKASYVYVHFATGGVDESGNAIYGSPVMAYTGNAAYVNAPGMPVYVGYGYSGELEIKQAHAEGLRQAGIDARVLNPLNQQSKFVYLWQLTMGLASTVATALTDSFLITVKSFRHYVGNTFQTFETPLEADKIDLAPYVPIADMHCYAALWLDTYTNTITITTSTAQALNVPLDLTDVQECAVLRPADAIPLKAFYLADNQATIKQSALDTELRQILNAPHIWGFPNILSHIERVWPNRTLVTGPYTTSGAGAITLESGAQIIIVYKNNFIAVTAPGAGDDSADGYSIGSLWFDTITGLLYVATSVGVGMATWAAISGSGAITSWTLAGDGGSPQAITNGNTATIAGGTGLSSISSATDTVTLKLDDTTVTPGAYTNADITIDAQGRITAAANGSGGSGAPDDATYIVQTADAGLANAQAMGGLGTGIVFNTTTTGVQSIAVAGTDYTSPTGTENLSNKTITASSLNSTPVGTSVPDTGGFTTGSFKVTDAATNTVVNPLIIGHNSSSAAANGSVFGEAILFTGQSSAAPDREMGRVRAVWPTATDASRSSALIFSTWAIGVETDMLTLTPTGAAVAGSLSVKHSADSAPLGTELLTNGTFTGSLTPWTGTNWSSSSNTALHAAGSTAVLTQTGISVTSGRPYILVVTVSGRTAGSVTPAIGAATGTAVSTNITSTQTIYAATTGSVSVTLTPTTDFDGAVDDVSVKIVDVWTSALTVLSPALSAVTETRANASNVLMGQNAGRYLTTGANNFGLGNNALMFLTTGSSNMAMGFNALNVLRTGSNNLGIGAGALQLLTTGVQNTALGGVAGSGASTSNNSTYLGYGAGQSNSGGNNVYIGAESGASSSTANSGIFIGYRSGQLETNSNRLVIGNITPASQSDGQARSILYGVMASTAAAQTLQINAAVTIPLSTANTSTPATALAIGANSTGTASAGFGPSVLFTAESSTTDNQPVATIDAPWISATHASRAGAMTLNAYSTTTKQEGVRIEADAGGLKLAFFGGTANAQQTGGAATAGAAYTAAEQAMLQTLWDMARAYALLT